MTHEYNITGMTCTGCQAKVTKLLKDVPNVKDVQIDLAAGRANITMERHISTNALQAALQQYPKYTLRESEAPAHHMATAMPEVGEEKSFAATYKPLFLIAGYLLLVTLSIQFVSGGFSWMQWMNHFMAGFFLIFSFFKLLDLNGFADSYSSYDIIARKWRGWGLIYPFAELGLGLLYLTHAWPLITNSLTILIMGISIIGVLQSVLNKRKIKCACLGAVFNLPMSTITIIEDALMIGMSAVMLFWSI